jgi:hypothetical protein
VTDSGDIHHQGAAANVAAEVNKYHRSFTYVYITGATAYKYKKLFKDRFYLCYAKDYTNGIIPQDILISFNRQKKLAEKKT